MNDCQCCAAGTFRIAGPPSVHSGGYTRNWLLDSTVEAGLRGCKPCRRGTYLSAECSDHASDCRVCPAGKYTKSAGATSWKDCLLCPPGKFLPRKPLADDQPELDCRSCPTGTFVYAWGGDHRSDCKRCSVGTYSSPNRQGCQSCPRGKTTHGSGADHVGDCESCPPGTYSQALLSPPQLARRGTEDRNFQQMGDDLRRSHALRAQSCRPCLHGTFQPVAGGDHIADCVACPPGKYSTHLSALPFQCSDCGRGKFTSRGTEGADHASDCAPCPSGSYFSGFAFQTGHDEVQLSVARDVVACTACGAGKHSVGRWVTALDHPSDCVMCPPGSFSMPSTADGTARSCLPCDEGTFTSTYGADHLTDCEPCPGGSFTLHANSTSLHDHETRNGCMPCPAGTYWFRQGGGRFQPGARCVSCPAGTHSSSSAADHVSDCIACEPGTFRENVRSGTSTERRSCSPCPVGTWSDQYAAQGPGSCRTCPPGRSTSRNGQASLGACTPCPLAMSRPLKAAVYRNLGSYSQYKDRCY